MSHIGNPRSPIPIRDTIYSPVALVLPVLFRSVPVVLLVALAACGSKGAPLAPLRPLPAQITDLRASRLDDTVTLQFRLPAANVDDSVPADLQRVDVYALTGRAEGPEGRALTPRELEQLTTRLATIEVQPPPPPSEEDDEEVPEPIPPPVIDDPRPVQGSEVSVSEELTPAMLATLFEHPDAARLAARLAAAAGDDLEDVPDVPSTEGSGRPLLWMLRPIEPTRSYVAVPYSTRNRPGPPSAPIAVPYVPAPPTPPAPTVEHTATAFVLSWENPEGMRLPVQRTVTEALATAEELLPTRPIVVMSVPQTYRVYEMPSEDAPASAVIGPLNAVPLETPAFVDPRIAFGAPRCYAVRAVEQRDSIELRSRLSPVTCITARDIYPPLAPTGLTAVGSEGGVSLIWEPSAEPDLAGYLVLRGEPDGVLKPLMEVPVAETTYRDTTTQAGVMYEYAVVAVDNATPGNVSPESNRVREAAR